MIKRDKANVYRFIAWPNCASIKLLWSKPQYQHWVRHLLCTSEMQDGDCHTSSQPISSVSTMETLDTNLCHWHSQNGVKEMFKPQWSCCISPPRRSFRDKLLLTRRRATITTGEIPPDGEADANQIDRAIDYYHKMNQCLTSMCRWWRDVLNSENTRSSRL